MVRKLHSLTHSLTHIPLNCILATLAFILLLILSIPGASYAKVTGNCVNCHTMHNSQNGTAMATLGGGTGPYNWLNRGSCVGCHMATNSDTWKDGLTGAPIVYNTSAPTYGASYGGGPKQGLAGGNFYWVADAGGNDDTKGHNVWGISGVDPNLAYNPGSKNWCATSCHTTLAADPASTTPYESSGWRRRNGCEGCHVHVRHHKNDGCYRFLYAIGDPDNVSVAVRGQEDPNWEKNSTSSTHNTYIGTVGTYYLSDGGGNISAFCAGCHKKFHDPTASGMGTGSPWLRHPTDVVIPNSGEYSAYTTYDPIAPVGRPEGNFPADPSQVRPGTDMVICMSCHRAHGSPYADILRWDYSTMVAGGGGSGGCFTCHTQKNTNP